jgi:hypothetical protein
MFQHTLNHGHVISGGDPGKSTDYRTGNRLLPRRAGTFTWPPLIWESFILRHRRWLLQLAAGAAFASQVQQSSVASVVFFGDGAMEEGVFYEALNIAKLWQLPLIFLMENNYRAAGRSGSSQRKELSINVPRPRRRNDHRRRRRRGCDV